MENMKIILMRPKPHAESIGLHSLMVCESLELMQLAGVLKANNFQVEIVDMILEKENLETILADKNPDVVGLTGYISHVNVIKEYAHKIRKFNSQIQVVVGGVHATVCPDDFTSNDIDFIAKDADAFYRHIGCRITENILPYRALPKRYLKHYYSLSPWWAVFMLREIASVFMIRILIIL